MKCVNVSEVIQVDISNPNSSLVNCLLVVPHTLHTSWSAVGYSRLTRRFSTCIHRDYRDVFRVRCNRTFASTAATLAINAHVQSSSPRPIQIPGTTARRQAGVSCNYCIPSLSRISSNRALLKLASRNEKAPMQR